MFLMAWAYHPERLVQNLVFDDFISDEHYRTVECE